MSDINETEMGIVYESNYPCYPRKKQFIKLKCR